MFQSKQVGAKLIRISILDPKEPEDATSFFRTLDELVGGEKFGLILFTEGKAGFCEQDKRKLTSWFRAHKSVLRDKCLGYARVNTKTGLLGKLESKAMKLAMPCPYLVTRHEDHALKWLKNLAEKI